MPCVLCPVTCFASSRGLGDTKHGTLGTGGAQERTTPKPTTIINHHHQPKGTDNVDMKTALLCDAELQSATCANVVLVLGGFEDSLVGSPH